MNRPILVITCSKDKLETPAEAMDFYTGSLFKLIKFNIPCPLEYFRVLILSAKFGLIDTDNKDLLSVYDQQLTIKNVPDFICDKQNQIIATLKSVAITNKNKNVFVVMSKPYLFALDSALFSSKEDVNISSLNFSILRNHRGIFEMRSALKKILLTEKEKYNLLSRFKG